MNITVDDAAKAKLRAILENEDEDAVVRIRETKVGSACKSKFVLRLSIDTAEDDDVKTEVEAMSFVISQDLADQYGTGFNVTLDAEGVFEVKAPQ